MRVLWWVTLTVFALAVLAGNAGMALVSGAVAVLLWLGHGRHQRRVPRR